MPINSRRKGKTGELEFAAFLKENGIKARRGQQFSGGKDSPDVIADLPGVHFEVKRTETLQLYKALAQAQGDGLGIGMVQVVAHRQNKKDWVGIIDMRQLLVMLKWWAEYVISPEFQQKKVLLYGKDDKF